jgi:hypothetical protein
MKALTFTNTVILFLSLQLKTSRECSGFPHRHRHPHLFIQPACDTNLKPRPHRSREQEVLRRHCSPLANAYPDVGPDLLGEVKALARK